MKTILCLCAILLPFSYSEEVNEYSLDLHPSNIDCIRMNNKLQTLAMLALVETQENKSLLKIKDTDTIGKIVNLYICPKNGICWDIYNPPKSPFLFGLRLVCGSLFGKELNIKIRERLEYVDFISRFKHEGLIPYHLIDKVIVVINRTGYAENFVFDIGSNGNTIFSMYWVDNERGMPN